MSDEMTAVEVGGGGNSGEILRIVPNETGFDIVIPDGVEPSHAALMFIATVRQMLAAQKGDGWVSVADKLPEGGMQVMIKNDKHFGHAYLCTTMYWQDAASNDRYAYNEITHWKAIR